MRQYGDVDWGALRASYLGVFGLGLYFMGIGLLMSALAPNQIIAAVLTFLVLGLLFALGIGEFVLDGWAKETCSYVSMWGQMQRFSKGVVDSRYLFFDVSLALFVVLMSAAVLKARRYV
jgi:ABC-2 type transport system permease protein